MAAPSFDTERLRWRVGLVVALALMLFTQFLIWEPWFGVPELVLSVLLTVAIVFIGMSILYLRRIGSAIGLGLAPPGSV